MKETAIFSKLQTLFLIHLPSSLLGLMNESAVTGKEFNVKTPPAESSGSGFHVPYNPWLFIVERRNRSALQVVSMHVSVSLLGKSFRLNIAREGKVKLLKVYYKWLGAKFI
ncbi:uncharacterized protein LOC114745621 [Neltuma alba]|uniref:uncharacterized protein LOC114745621 n=1 Tax=Neltuma alba TaxID=207710 RepID=UPI0010A40970|nr:uncharacterized protein LOC114745621 [Prosopis alba]